MVTLDDELIKIKKTLNYANAKEFSKRIFNNHRSIDSSAEDRYSNEEFREELKFIEFEVSKLRQERDVAIHQLSSIQSFPRTTDIKIIEGDINIHHNTTILLNTINDFESKFRRDFPSKINIYAIFFSRIRTLVQSFTTHTTEDAKSKREVNDTPHVLHELCEYLEQENTRLLKELRHSKLELEKLDKDVKSCEIIPHYRIALSSSKQHIIELKRQLKQLKQSNQTLSRQLLIIQSQQNNDKYNIKKPISLKEELCILDSHIDRVSERLRSKSIEQTLNIIREKIQ